MPTEPAITEGQVMIDHPGIFDIPAESYHADPCPKPSLSRGKAHVINTRTPAHAKLSCELEHNAQLGLGTVAHRLLLGKGDEYAVLPEEISPKDDFTTKDARAWKQERIDANVTPIKRKDHDIAQAMATRCREQVCHTELGDIFANGYPERTILWQEGDVWCRAMVDWMVGEDITVLVDYKTTRNAEAMAFRRALYSTGSYLQSYVYPRGVSEVLGIDETDVKLYFLAQEVDEPYLINVVEASGEMLERAKDDWRRAVGIWHRCLRSGKWNGYGPSIKMIDPPPWYIATQEERKLIEELNGVAA